MTGRHSRFRAIAPMAVLTALLSALPPASHASGINCAIAATAIDHAICASPALLAQDATMASLTAIILRNTATPALKQQFLAQQKSWLRDRNNNCQTGATACLLAAYQTRNLALKILTDRIGTAPLTNLQPILMRGKWLVTGPAAMLSPADNPNQETFDNSLDGQTPFAAHQHINLPAYDYAQNGLFLPGATLTASPDGALCAKGQDYTLTGDGPVQSIPANTCVRFGWIKTSLDQLAQAAPTPTRSDIPTPPGDPTPPLIPNRLAFLPYVSPTLFAHDLDIPPTAPAYIGFIRQRIDGEPPTYTRPQPAALIIPGHDGALYAVVALDIIASPKILITIAYQKWLPTSPAAKLQTLP